MSGPGEDREAKGGGRLGGSRTLFEGFRFTTISEWTLGVKRELERRAFTALYAAASTCLLETSWAPMRRQLFASCGCCILA